MIYFGMGMFILIMFAAEPIYNLVSGIKIPSKKERKEMEYIIVDGITLPVLSKKLLEDKHGYLINGKYEVSVRSFMETQQNLKDLKEIKR